MNAIEDLVTLATSTFVTLVVLAVLVTGFFKGREWMGKAMGDDSDPYGPLSYERDEYEAAKRWTLESDREFRARSAPTGPKTDDEWEYDRTGHDATGQFGEEGSGRAKDYSSDSAWSRETLDEEETEDQRQEREQAEEIDDWNAQNDAKHDR